RYETALRYRDTPGAAPGADHVMVLIYSAHENGLALAPWHRVIRDVDNAAPVLDAASRLYDTTRVSEADQLIGAMDSSSEAGVLGLWTRGGGSVLRVDRSRAAEFVDAQASEAVRWLDVSVLSGTL